MNVDGTHYRAIWSAPDDRSFEVIDQTRLPHAFEIARIETAAVAADAIARMVVRGAPLIGATAAYGLALAVRDDPSERAIESARAMLLATRPTAVNLRWALDRVRGAILAQPESGRFAAAWRLAEVICDEDVEINRSIGQHGLELLRGLAEAKPAGEPLRILTHCNAGWLATVDWGTALAPVYMAHQDGIALHVWVDETRPRNQGAGLTAWELGHHGVPHSVIVDNAGGHLMQRGLVDCCIVGSDRTTATGDVCNKVGTYLKALAARESGVPFYVALPGPTIDFTLDDGQAIEIEQRDPREVTHVTGRSDVGDIVEVRVTPEGVDAVNIAFDVTPSALVTALVTDRGACTASREGIAELFPERTS